MRLLVVSEGKHELNVDGDTGALVELLRRMLPKGTSFERRKVSDRKLQQVVFLGKTLRHEKVILRWMRYAEREGYDGLAFVVDEDGKKDRRTAVESAQAHRAFTIPRAIGLAIQAFDAWMLADETAFGQAVGQRVTRQPKPEQIRHPKKTCQTLLSDAGEPVSLTDVYIEVARTADLECLSNRCPKGFAAFRIRVGALNVNS